MRMSENTGKFIYVFDTKSKKLLEDGGFYLLKSDAKNSIYVFQNTYENLDLLEQMSYLTSNKLTF